MLRNSRWDNRRFTGLTLVELLVVITIFVMLVAVVLPLAKPALKGRSAREATRQLSTFLMAAQARAIATRSSQGVTVTAVDLSRQPIPSYVTSYSITAVHFPPPSILTKKCVGAADPLFPYRVPISQADQDDVKLRRIVAESTKFLVRIGADYTPYIISGISSGTTPPHWLELGVVTDTSGNAVGAQHVPPKLGYGDAIRIVEWPPSAPRYATSGTIQLPAGAYIDMALSGVGSAKHFLLSDASKTVSIIFGPDGKLAWIHGALRDALTGNTLISTGPMRTTDDIHLLVSNAKLKDKRDPLRNTSGSFWVTVNHRTGGTTTSENIGFSDPAMNVDDALVSCRQAITKILTASGN